jgi:hypothetical protein
MIRQAISPRLAIKMRLNMRDFNALLACFDGTDAAAAGGCATIPARGGRI